MIKKDNITYMKFSLTMKLLLKIFKNHYNLFCPECSKKMNHSCCEEQKCWNCLSCGHVVIYRKN